MWVWWASRASSCDLPHLHPPPCSWHSQALVGWRGRASPESGLDKVDKASPFPSPCTTGTLLGLGFCICDMGADHCHTHMLLHTPQSGKSPSPTFGHGPALSELCSPAPSSLGLPGRTPLSQGLGGTGTGPASTTCSPGAHRRRSLTCKVEWFLEVPLPVLTPVISQPPVLPSPPPAGPSPSHLQLSLS